MPITSPMANRRPAPGSCTEKTENLKLSIFKPRCMMLSKNDGVHLETLRSPCGVSVTPGPQNVRFCGTQINFGFLHDQHIQRTNRQSIRGRVLHAGNMRRPMSGHQLACTSCQPLTQLPRRCCVPRLGCDVRVPSLCRSTHCFLSIKQLINQILTHHPATTGRCLAAARDSAGGGPVVVDGQFLAVHDIA